MNNPPSYLTFTLSSKLRQFHMLNLLSLLFTFLLFASFLLVLISLLTSKNKQ